MSSKKKRSTLDRQKIEQRHRAQSRAASRTRGRSPSRCSRGEVKRVAYPRKSYERAAYRRKSGTRVAASHIRRADVPASCIRATGRARSTGHKGKQLFVLNKGTLKKHEYENIK